MGNLFVMYVGLFLLPLCICLFTGISGDVQDQEWQEKIHKTMFSIATTPAIVLFMIELI
jgi:hypothetical protein